MSLTKRCFKCGETKVLSRFYKANGNKDGRSGKCKECTKKDSIANRRRNIDYYREYDRNRSKLPHRVNANTSRTRVYRKSNPEKYIAHCKINNAIRDGRAHKKPCAVCGTQERIEAHHFDYSRPLEVIWLCSEHHTAVHLGMKKLNSQAAA